MLDVEEGMFALKLLAVLLQEIGQSRDIAVVPVGTDEMVTVDGFHPDGIVLLAETFLPHLGRPFPDVLCIGRFGPHLVDYTGPCGSLHIMVAVDEQFLGALAVQSLVAGEHLEPGVGYLLQLRLQTLVGHVACNDNPVHLQ